MVHCVTDHTEFAADLLRGALYGGLTTSIGNHGSTDQ